MVGHLSESVHGFYSYYCSVTVTVSGVGPPHALSQMQLAGHGAMQDINVGRSSISKNIYVDLCCRCSLL